MTRRRSTRHLFAGLLAGAAFANVGAAPAASATSALHSRAHCSAAAHPDRVVETTRFSPGFAVRKATLSPDGTLLALAGRAGEILLHPLSGGVPRRGTSGVTDPIALQFAPDGSELWLHARDGRQVRIAPDDGTRIDDGFAWRTRVAGKALSVDSAGRTAFGSAHAEGTIVVDRHGSLDIAGAVLVVARADTVSRLPIDGMPRAGTERPPALTSVPTPPEAPARHALACGGTCLLTAAPDETSLTYVWRLAPFDGRAEVLPGNVFLNDGSAALDCAGRHALVSGATGIGRITLAPDPVRAGARLMRTHARAWIDGTGASAYLLAPDGALSIHDAATMTARAQPSWLSATAPLIAVAPDANTMLLRTRDGRAALVAAPIRLIRRFEGDIEALRPHFSAAGSLVAVRSDSGSGTGWTLHRVADGRRVGRLPDGVLLFAPDDRFAVSISDEISVHRLID